MKRLRLLAALVAALSIHSYADMTCVAAAGGECDLAATTVPTSLTAIVSGGNVHITRGWIAVLTGSPTITIQDGNSKVFLSFAGTAGTTYFISGPVLMAAGAYIQLTGTGTANFSVSIRP